MPERLRLVVDAREASAEPGQSVAALLLELGPALRRSTTGQPRGPLCGMGTCFECRVTIDGVAHQRACKVACRDGMVVETGHA